MFDAFRLRRKGPTQREQFQKLVDESRDEMYQLALRMTRNAEDAEDVLQDAYLKAYRTIDRFRGEANPKTWLYRIVVNTSLDHLRGASRKPKVLSFLSEEQGLSEPVCALPGPQRLLEGRQTREHLDRAMAVLSPLERSVFVLRHYQELPLKEIAQVLQRAEGTVKSTLFRALQKMRDQLEPQPLTREVAYEL